MAQLNRFGLVHYRGDIGPILRQLNSAKLRTLILAWVYWSGCELEQLLCEQPELVTGLERINLEYITSRGGGEELVKNRERNFEQLLQCICERLQGLKQLDLILADHVSFENIFLKSFCA